MAIGGLVGRDSNNLTPIHLFGDCQQFGQIGTQGFDILRAGVMLQSPIAEEHRLARPTQDRLSRLFNISCLRRAERIEPPAAAFRATDAAQPTHYEEAFVLGCTTPMS